MPLTVAGGNFFALLILLLWLIKANFKNDFYQLKNNKLVIAVLLYLLVHVVALLWTSDMQHGLYTLRKQLKFLFIPLFMLYVQREHIQYYIFAFLLSMSLSELWSYGIWFELLPLYGHATLDDPIPLMDHLAYPQLLTIAIYLLLYYVLFDPNIKKSKKYIYSFFIVTMGINMFINGGRAGQIMFFAMLAITVFQYFPKNTFKALIISLTVVLTTASTAYLTSKVFNQRVDLAVSEFANYKDFKGSVGERIVFAISSWDIFKEHPIIGVGTGDFKNEFAKKLSINAPHVHIVHDPHNMYSLISVQFGLVGLATLLWMFYTQIKIAKNSNDNFVRKIGVTMPLLYLLIMLSGSYLMMHMTGLLFIFMSSFIYKNYEKS